MSRFDTLYQIIRDEKASKIMEIGVHQCERSTKMVLAAMTNYAPSEITFYGYDLFEEMTPKLKREEISRPRDPYPISMARGVLRVLGVNYELSKGDSKETLPRFKGRVDIVFIDGGHSYQTALSDWENAKEISDLIIFDDYSKESKGIKVKEVVDSVDKSSFSVEITSSGDRATPAFGSVDLELAIVRRK